MNPLANSMCLLAVFLISLVYLITGLINPKKINKIFRTKNKLNRKNIFISWIIILLITVILNSISITIYENSLNKQVEKFKKGELTSISSEIARKYVAKYCDVSGCLDTQNSPSNKLTSVTPEVLDAFYSSSSVMVDGISLNGLTSLQLEVAKKLKGRGTSLNGLNTISLDVAIELVNSGSIYLDMEGINLISSDTAKELAKYKGFLNGSDYLMKEIKKYGYSPSEKLTNGI